MAAIPLTADAAAWLEVFAEAGERVREAVAPLAGTDAGRVVVGVGAGGDRTVELDRLAEEAILAILRRTAARGRRFSVLTEEAGRVELGAEYPLVVVDPVDGSLNAKQGIPCYAVMLSVADGPTVGDLQAGYTLNLVDGTVWTATRGGGSFRNGEPLRPLARRDPSRIETVALESSPRSVFDAAPLLKRAGKLRILGSVAISLAQAAAGSVDVFCSPMRSRVFDLTAGALLISEAGGVVTDLAGRPIDHLQVGLDVRTTILAAADPSAHRLALELLDAG